MSTTTEKHGDTTLRNVRAPDDLWFPAKDAARRAGTDMSAVARDAWQALLDRETDEVWQEASRLTAARGTTPEAVMRRALEQWVSRQLRRENRT